MAVIVRTYNGSNIHRANLQAARLKANARQPCRFCSKERSVANIGRHEASCYLNPTNLVHCPVCAKPIESKSRSIRQRSKTCSHACANTLFRSGSAHPNWKEESYRSTCFAEHARKCVVCNESRVVEVHHMDENRENNQIDNLVPLCPTHHRYWHSRHRHIIADVVYGYVSQFKNER
jgi:hypothetical protein